MAKRDKLKAKILAMPVEIDFEDLKSALEQEEWTERPVRSGSSHHSFYKAGERRLVTIPTVGGRKVKREYIGKVIEALGWED